MEGGIKQLLGQVWAWISLILNQSNFFNKPNHEWFRSRHTFCGELACGGLTLTASKSCSHFKQYEFVTTSVTLIQERYNHLCWAIDGGIFLIGGGKLSSGRSLNYSSVIFGISLVTLKQPKHFKSIISYSRW